MILENLFVAALKIGFLIGVFFGLLTGAWCYMTFSLTSTSDVGMIVCYALMALCVVAVFKMAEEEGRKKK